MLLAAGFVVTLLSTPPNEGVAEPWLGIVHEGSNQFTIAISNSVATNYTLLWAPTLPVGSDEWVALWGVEGTNTTFTAQAPAGWFRVMVGMDGDVDGFPPWIDANDNDPSIGALTVIIDSPLNGESLN